MPSKPVHPIYDFHRTPLFARVSVMVGMLGLYSAAIVGIDHNVLANALQFRSTLHTYLTLVLGGLLVFRTNTAYDRWWEGRKLWGQLVNDCRNLAIKTQNCVRAESHEKRLLARRLISFCYALKDHLRDGAKLSSLDGFRDSTDSPEHVPAYITSSIYRQLESWRQSNQLGRIELLFLDTHAAALMNICGACERIRRSPISVSWRAFIRQIIAIYMLTLPFALEEEMGYWCIPIVMMVGYFMIGLESIAEDVEQPFGTGDDDLNLDEICGGIRRSVLEIVGEPETTPE